MSNLLEAVGEEFETLERTLEDHIRTLKADLAEAEACRDRVGAVLNGQVDKGKAAKEYAKAFVASDPTAGSGPLPDRKCYVLLGKLPANGKTFTVAIAAGKLKCSKNYAYTLLRELVSEGLVEKVDRRNYRRK